MNKLDAAIDLIGRLRVSTADDAAECTRLIRESFDLAAIDDAEFARKLHTDRSTVKRWRLGEVVPIRAVRPNIYATLVDELSCMRVDGCQKPGCTKKHDDETVCRADGCECQLEEGDSPCPVHGLDEERGEAGE